MADNNITFSKIVANPNSTTWSQAYNAGRLFAVISLHSPEESEEKDYLNILGKDILDTLEQEFFGLETKDLDSIKQAVSTTSEKIPSNINCSFVVASYVNNILYLYILGGGKISLKREGKFGNLLESDDTLAKSIKDASGYLQDKDTVILQTKQFTDVIHNQTLSEFIDNRLPSEISEHLAPLVHEKDEPGAAAIIINYKKPHEVAQVEDEFEVENKDTENEIEKSESPFFASSIDKEKNKPNILKNIISKFIYTIKPKFRTELNHPRKVILTIIIVILIIFVLSIFFAVKKQQDSKVAAIFQSIYPQATKKYEEGKGLLSLNEGFAEDSFNEAKTLIEENKNKLPNNSSEQKQMLDLLNKINLELSQAPKPNSITAKLVGADESNLLSAQLKNSGKYYTFDKNNIYVLTDSLIYSLKTDGTGKKTLIENEKDWESIGGFANYFGNLYVLDKNANQIIKFVESEGSYTKTDYFTDNADVNFSKSVDIAIDSSIYVLSQDGKVTKYNKGSLEDFNISGLDKEMLSPTKIVASANNDYIYILDNGNSRIVVLEKSGKYKIQYQANVIKTAKNLDVSEDNNKAYILSGQKVYEINLK